jgi:indole-3-glycerol phosphate synthase
MAFLDQVLQRKQEEIAAAKKLRSLEALKSMLRDAPAIRPFSAALGNQFGLIAEIKRRSPSAGDMRKENVEGAPAAYARSAVVKAVSVLTNGADFGMSIEELTRVKAAVPKPILRKDFILEEYQVYEARAFGADALLLMANVLEREQMRKLFEKTRELGMDVLFEAHTKKEIESIPAGAKLYGINSRKFKASNRWLLARMLLRFGFSKSGKGPDLSVEMGTFSLIEHLPKHAIKIAESGVKPAKLLDVVKLGYDAVLVGTSLLKAPEGIESKLAEFEQALAGSKGARDTQVSAPV